MAEAADAEADGAIRIGAAFQAEYELGAYHTADMMGGSGDVVASAVLIHFMEVCCFDYLHAARPDSDGSWGFRVSMEHKSPASASRPLRVTCTIAGCFAGMVRISFEIFQEGILVATGSHDRKLSFEAG